MLGWGGLGLKVSLVRHKDDVSQSGYDGLVSGARPSCGNDVSAETVFANNIHHGLG